MAKTQRILGGRVVIYPRRLGNLGSVHIPDGWASDDVGGDTVKRCEEIREQVKRHVDYAEHVEIEQDAEYVCEHCGSSWTEDSDSFNGGCCDKDMDVVIATLWGMCGE